jgi:ABC-type transport system substrate-binding protein
VRTVPRDVLIKSVLSVADEWKRLGIVVDVILTAQQQSDREFYATYPAFDTARSNNGLRDFFAFHSSQVKTPETRYTGSNRSGYVNADLDGLVDRYFATIPVAERLQIAGRVVHHVTDQVVFFPLFYDLTPTVASNRLVNFPRRIVRSSTPTWNVHSWDIRE